MSIDHGGREKRRRHKVPFQALSLCLDPRFALAPARFSAPHAARCAACHGVRSHVVPVALVGECSMPVV